MLNNFDFSLLETLNEISVCQSIIDPILKALGFVLKNPKKPQAFEMTLAEGRKTDIQFGTHPQNPVNLIPDYVLYREQKEFCILDAKAPSEKIHKDSKHYKQAQSYALGFECEFFALCNGKEFIIYRFGSGEIVLQIDIEKDLNAKFKHLQEFFTSKKPKIQPTTPKQSDEWYLSREIPKAILKPRKQIANRYFGTMPYFTKQSWDIVAQNIKAFTNEGDVVLDSFGGSGVTAIEAMMNGRLGIHTDLNPLSIFMVKALTAKVNLGDLWDLSEQILAEFNALRPKNEKEAKALLKNAKYYKNAIDEEFGESATAKKQDEILWIPKDELLPKGSDVPSVLGLFSPLQLAELALLRKLIFKHTTPSGTKEARLFKRNLRYSLLLAFHNAVKSLNLTFHKSKTGGGDSAAFRHFRYRVAKEPTILDTAKTFKNKVEYVIKSKRIQENSPHFYNAYFAPLERTIKDFSGAMLSQRQDLSKTDSILDKINGEKIFQADATNLKEIENESVDFIYTDPPYSNKIAYLDLSTLWNAWLDFSVDDDLREKECIEKGSLEKSRDEYIILMKKSLNEMYRVLKFNRWLAFVFQHQDPQLWQILVDAAENAGFEYVVSIRQDNGQTSFIKRQHKQRILAGQLILYFRKVRNPKALIKEKVGDTLALVLNNIEALIARDNGATLEEIYADLQIRGLELGFYHELGKMYNDLTPLINENFDLDKTSGKYHIKKGEKFKSHLIDIKTRTRYFVLSFLRGCERQNRRVTLDDITLEVIPLLKNGITPEKKLISDILKEIAVPNKETGEWRLKPKEPSLFDGI
ncbi:DNA methyltransferase [Campylobacter troglodytis]|uniref:DNA methyltransferase n=1 Tax=Campylobacter troglodytis TaxID=654363 RepID=UPI001159D85E|nr:DNA methyltransferase [Campylobacter troglodytis]TQR60504.1 hypothetical protein DMC01_05430 [Campylobacter troglodytis]